MTSFSTPIRAILRNVPTIGRAGPSRCGTLIYPGLRALPRNTPRSVISPINRRWNSSASTSAFASGETAATRAPGTEEQVSDDNVSNEDSLRLEAPQEGAKPQKLGQIEPRLSLTFTCTADACGHRSTHEFSKRSYTKGIVLVQCPSCKNRHLIADHLGWFKESTEEGILKTVEDLLRAKGETIRTGRVNFEGDIEYDGESSSDLRSKL